MSFLLAPLLLIFAGVTIVYINVRFIFKKIKNETVRMRLIPLITIFTLAIFFIFDISLFLNLKWIEWLWKILGAKSGLDLILNSKIFNFDYSWPIQNKKVLALSILLFCSYPLWLWLGLQIGFVLFGVNEKQNGMIGLLFFKPHPHSLPPPEKCAEKEKT